MPKKIIFVHLLNDYSGSPLVLSQVVNIVNKLDFTPHLLLGNLQGGFLDTVDCDKSTFYYRRSESRVVVLLNYLFSQLSLAVLTFKLVKFNDTVLYVNTMLPFGAAIVGRLMRCKVIYHIHETSITPNALKLFLKFVIRMTASHAIYVSNYLINNEGVSGVSGEVIYNAVSEKCYKKGYAFKPSMLHADLFNVLMVCSLRDYKGVNEFIKLSALLEKSHNIHFNLVLNASDGEVSKFIQDKFFYGNISFFSATDDVDSWYQKSSLVINLSQPHRWVETFGMTLLEAMTFGLPVIGPTIGGPLELIENGVNGYCISSDNISEIADAIDLLASNPPLWETMSTNAKKMSKQFSHEKFTEKISVALSKQALI